eukprot:SAG11_NODE_337_length_10541_cov_14.862574_2_plen_94_part_00
MLVLQCAETATHNNAEERSARRRVWGACDVTDPPFAAVGDGKHDDTAAIRNALQECDSVLLPDGKRFLTGPLNLTSNQVLIVVSCDHVNEIES